MTVQQADDARVLLVRDDFFNVFPENVNRLRRPSAGKTALPFAQRNLFLIITRPAKTMKALVKAEAKRGLWLREEPVPEIGINDVLIRVDRTGICGTDLHIYNWD